jgi:hypothetical protein
MSHDGLGLAHLITRFQHGDSSPKCNVIAYAVMTERLAEDKPKCGLCKEHERG